MNPTDWHSATVKQFSKWPEEGRVKTRLIPELGAAGALQAHIRLSLKVLDNLLASGLPVEFWWDRPLETVPRAADPVLAVLEKRQVPQRFQRGTDLGERMSLALAEGLVSYSQAIIVGSDCPSVTAGYVQQAAAVLGETDVVLGPSDDGGYVLIGCRRMLPGMLDGIAWGTTRVLDQTCQRLESLGLRYCLLEPLWDVDEPADWQRFLGQSADPAC